MNGRLFSRPHFWTLAASSKFCVPGINKGGDWGASDMLRCLQRGQETRGRRECRINVGDASMFRRCPGAERAETVKHRGAATIIALIIASAHRSAVPPPQSAAPQHASNARLRAGAASSWTRSPPNTQTPLLGAGRHTHARCASPRDKRGGPEKIEHFCAMSEERPKRSVAPSRRAQTVSSRRCAGSPRLRSA